MACMISGFYVKVPDARADESQELGSQIGVCYLGKVTKQDCPSALGAGSKYGMQVSAYQY